MNFTPEDIRQIFFLAADLIGTAVSAHNPLPPPGTTGDDAGGQGTTSFIPPTALDWEKHLGPSFADLNPGQPDRRPTLFTTPDKPATSQNTFIRCNPFNVGVEDGDLADYWSCSGQVIFFPPNPLVDPGVDRIQTFAHYNGVFATSPRFDVASGQFAPEPYMVEQSYKKAIQPLGMVRNQATWQNDALVIWANGCLTCAGTQTSRPGEAWPLPFLQLPPEKKPTGAITVTTSNEFAFIGVTDTKTGRGQLAVVALEGKWISFHTWPYMGLVNRGAFSDFKLLGYVDLSIKSPDSISASTDGFWDSPGQTQNWSLGQMLLDQSAKDGQGNVQNWTWGQQFQSSIQGKDPAWAGVFAFGGYVIVSSKSEGKVVLVDLKPLMPYPVNSWVYDYANTAANRGPGPSQWPQTFDTKPEIKPVQVVEYAVNRPTCVLAGQLLDRWSQDFYKAYVACEEGSVQIIDVTSLRSRWGWERKNPLGIIGSFPTGRNPIDMCWARFDLANLPLIPADSHSDPTNNLLWIAARGEREAELAVSFGNHGKVAQQIQHSGIDDVSGVSVADRANILTITDWTKGMVHSLRIGNLQAHSGALYGPGQDGKAFCEYAGGLKIPSPIKANSCNVN